MDILFAEGSKRNVTVLKPETVKDLAIQEIIDNIVLAESEMLIIRDIFTKIPTDIRDIRFRQEIMKDFLENEELTEELSEALGMIKTLKDYSGSRIMRLQNDSTLYTLLENLREMAVYVNVSESIADSLKKHAVKSEGLCRLSAHLEEIVRTEKFVEAKKDIDIMLDELSCVRGAYVGVNFTPDMNVGEVAIVEFVPYKIKSKYKFAEIAASFSNILNTAPSTNTIGKPMVNVKVEDPLLVAMTPEIEKHLKKHFVRLKSVMSRHVNMDNTSITEMFEALTFYIALARFGRRMKSEGQVICFPELPSPETDISIAANRSFEMKDLYNVRLFISGEKNIVKNDFAFTPNENLFILTGPNRGGKTIIEQAIGIISIMTSIGAFVTASSCKGVPFNNILTHFPIDENLTINYGRLGEEAVRIKEIVKESDDSTLILFNETYSTTSAADGLYLSKDLLRILKERGTAVIFNTHIHEVAKALDEMNQWEGQSEFVSLVMEIKDNENTFHVKRSAPESKSYARNIAEKYGITYEQMKGE